MGGKGVIWNLEGGNLLLSVCEWGTRRGGGSRWRSFSYNVLKPSLKLVVSGNFRFSEMPTFNTQYCDRFHDLHDKPTKWQFLFESRL